MKARIRRNVNLVSTLFAGLARARNARVFHPHGVLLHGTLILREGPIQQPNSSAAVTALGGPAQHPVVVRLSKAVGTPGAWPDLLGISVKIDLDGGQVDLLTATVGQSGWRRLFFRPTSSWCRTPYSTVLPYQAGQRRLLLGLSPERRRSELAGLEALKHAADSTLREDPLVFSFEERDRAGWSAVGRLVITGPIAESDASYDPYLNALASFAPVPLLSRLRRAAYAGSRRGRGAADLPAEANPAAKR